MQPIVDSLLKYINRAFEKNRPTLLLVQYDQDTDKNHCLKSVATKLKQHDIPYSIYDLLKDKQYADGGLYNQLADDSKSIKLSIICSLPLEQSGTIINQKFLNYLNIYRDRVTKHNLHIVLFIHSMHMKQFIQDANDLWSFQRKTFWLENKPTEDLTPLIELLSIEQTADSNKDNQASDAKETANYLTKIQQQLKVTQSTNNKLLILTNAASRVLRHKKPDISLELATKAELLFTSSKSELANQDKQDYAAKITKQLGETHFALGNYEQALEYLNQSNEQYELGDNTTAVNLNKEIIARVYIKQGAYQDALQYLQHVLNSRLQYFDETHPDVIASYDEIAQCHSHLGQYNQAIEYYKKLHNIYVKLHGQNHLDVASSCNQLGKFYDVTGQYDLALEYFKQSLAITQQLGDKKHVGIALNNISQIFEAKGDYDTALAYLKQSLAITQQLGDIENEGIVFNNMSHIFYAKGDYDSALAYLQQSLAITQQLDDKQGEGTTLNNISAIYNTKGDYDTALEYLKQSLAIMKGIGDIAGLCATLFNIGYIHFENNQTEQAVSTWFEVYKIAKPAGLAQTLQTLEDLAQQIGIENGLEGWEALYKQSQTK